MAVKIQLRRDTAANWTAVNPLLAAGEAGFETDTAKLKLGDGSTAWNALAYFAGSGGGGGGPTDTDALPEGSTNLYHTTARARGAAVVNSMAGTQTDQAPSVASVDAEFNAVAAALAGKASTSHGHSISDTTGLQTALDGKASTLHASSHQSGGTDAIKLDDLNAPDDNTDLDASTTRHGLLRKLSNVATEILNGAGNWVAGVWLNVVQAWTKQQYFGTATLTDGANISWNLDDGQVAKVTLGGNRTLDNPTNMKDGGTYVLRVIQDGTGGRTLAYGSAYKWPIGVVPVLSTGIGDIDFLTFVSDGTNMYGVFQGDFS